MSNIAHVPGLLKTHIDFLKKNYIFFRKIPYLFLGKEDCFSNSALNTVIQPLFLRFGWKQYNFFDFSFDFQILSVILWLVNDN